MREGIVGIVAVASLLLSCAITPPISVVRRASGDKAEEIRGDHVKLKRSDLEGLGGMVDGYHVVRSEEDWKKAWPTGVAPRLPAIDTSKQMLVIGVAETKSISHVRIQKAVETDEMLFVWIQESKVGQGCVSKSAERAFDMVTTARADKPVRFFVDTTRAESCGEAPVAGVECRLKNQQQWAKSITAQPGDSVECELSANTQGNFALIDRVLGMADLPAGSSAKLNFAKGPFRGEFGVDVYGTYTVTAEAADEGGRRGKGTATVDVKPPKTKDVLVQLVWSGFDIKDDSETFPRVNLRVADEKEGQRCSAEIPIPGLCEVKTRGAYTYMRIPAGARKLPISVQFLDERAEKGPGPCVHVWFDGQRTAETCDRKHRDQEEIWRVGLVDTATGKLDGAPPLTPPPAAADAGAPPAKPVPPKKK